MKNCTNYLMKTLLFLLIFIIIFCSYLILCWFVLKINVKDVFFHSPLLTMKIDYAKSIEEPKIVIVGGSSVLLGINADQIEKEIEFPVVNFGTHADVHDLSMYKLKKILKPGDIVIGVFEYNLYYSKKRSWFERIGIRENIIYEIGKDYFRNSSNIEKTKLLAISMRDIIYRLNTNNQLNDSYELKNITEKGDQNRRLMYSDELFKKMRKKIYADDFKLNAKNKNYLLSDLSEFINWCGENNIGYIGSFPPLLQQQLYLNNEKYIKFFSDIQNYYQSMQIKTIASPQKFFYPKSYFYNTMYHLNSYGKKINTNYLISFLKQML